MLQSIKRYIILDDDILEDYDEELLQHLVKTSFVNDGLTDNHKKKAIEKFILGGRMDIKKIFEETEKIGEEQNKLRERIYQLNQCLDAIATQCSHEIVFKYTEKNTRNNNYLELESDWIETNIDYSEEEIEGDQDYTYASGAKSASYAVLVDNVAPLAPGFELEGTLGDNGWYTSDVKVTMIPSKTDLIARSELYSDTWGSDSVVGGVGVYKNYIETTGANIKTKAEYVS